MAANKWITVLLIVIIFNAVFGGWPEDLLGAVHIAACFGICRTYSIACLTAAGFGVSETLSAINSVVGVVADMAGPNLLPQSAAIEACLAELADCHEKCNSLF